MLFENVLPSCSELSCFCNQFNTDYPKFIGILHSTRRLVLKKNCFSAWASTLNMGLINKVDMVCLSPVGYGV